MRNLFIWSAIAVLSLAALAAGLDKKPLAAGRTAPTFSLPTLEGKREMLSIWAGETLSKPYINKEPHTVIISFWATWCKPCQKEIPELMRFAEKHRDSKIKLFCISIDKEGASIVKPFVQEKGYTVPVLLDPYQKTAERYGVRSLPALVVIGPDGVIRHSSVGYTEDLLETLENAVAAASEGRNYTEESKAAGGEQSVMIEHALDSGQTEGRKQAGNGESVNARQKWQAVAAVECGRAIDSVAAEIGVAEDDIRKWYEELKRAAIALWKDSAATP
jgi:thiol-disulfide isomerase/thioredoxin